MTGLYKFIEVNYMKTLKKNFIIMAVILSMVTGAAAMPAKTYAKESYYFYGVSEAGDGSMEMYFNENKITLDGSFRKSPSKKKVYDADEKKRTVNLKIAKNCKIINDEAGNLQTIQFKKWVKDNGYKSGDEITFISAFIKVVNKKIASITFSA